MASKNFKMSYSVDDEGVDREIEVEVSFSKGHDAYFSKSFGNYLPGDPDEIVYEGACWVETRTPLTDKEYETWINNNPRLDEAVYDYLSTDDER